MAEKSVEPEDRQRWKKNSTRHAILQAARSLAEREGPDAVTLGRVAAEAGFAPPAVYAYFVTKDELHLALVSDDLETIAEAMRGEPGTPESGDAEVLAFELAQQDRAEGELEVKPEVAEFASADAEFPAVAAAEPISLAEIQQAIGVILDEDGEAEVDKPAVGEFIPDAFPEDAVGAPADEPAEEIAPVDTSTTALPAEDNDPILKKAEPRWRRGRLARKTEQIAMPLEEQQELDVVPVLESEDAAIAEAPFAALPGVPLPDPGGDTTTAAIARLEEAVARLENRPVDAWLERRLRVFERTLADLEARMEKAERNSAVAVAQTGVGRTDLEQRVGEALSTAQRDAHERDERQRAAFTDLRAYIKDLAGRLGALEISLSRVMEAPDQRLQPEPIAVGQDSEADEPERPSDIASDRSDYLSSARRAANAAALKAESARAGGARSAILASPPRRQVPRWVLSALTAIMILAVAAVGVSVYLRSRMVSPVPVVHAAMPATQTNADARVVALAKAGDSQAELVAGLKLLEGDGTETDVPSAAYWLRKAALQHQPVAEYWLGTLYERGRGVAFDKKAAMGWYNQSAQAGNAKAMYRLGVAYAEGWGGAADAASAAKWFDAAAKLGVIDAQFNLAVLYERGTGVTQDLKQAFTWYAIAAAQGDAESKARIDVLASQLAPGDVAGAQQAAATFQPASPSPKANSVPTAAEVAALHR